VVGATEVDEETGLPPAGFGDLHPAKQSNEKTAAQAATTWCDGRVIIFMRTFWQFLYGFQGFAWH